MSKHSELMQPHLQILSAEMGLSFTVAQMELFARYDDFLIDYNTKTNLTRIIEPCEVAVKHFGDSLALLQQEVLPIGAIVVDVGTGAGFPGIPLAIARSDLRVTLVDSLRKRIVFLVELIQQLGLSNVDVVWGRAEELAQNPKYRGQFDVVIARAVAPLNILAELCLPFARTEGCFLAMKGPKAEEEVAAATNALKILGGKVCATTSITLPILNDLRSLVRIGKIASTPRAYPRKAGMPERQPL
jgi:16S rRNA (guanine527-N7)-methyltransferase